MSVLETTLWIVFSVFFLMWWVTHLRLKEQEKLDARAAKRKVWLATAPKEEVQKFLETESKKKQKTDLCSGRFRTDNFNPERSFIFSQKGWLDSSYEIQGIYFDSKLEKIMTFKINVEDHTFLEPKKRI